MLFTSRSFSKTICPQLERPGLVDPALNKVEQIQIVSEDVEKMRAIVHEWNLHAARVIALVAVAPQGLGPRRAPFRMDSGI